MLSVLLNKTLPSFIYSFIQWCVFIHSMIHSLQCTFIIHSFILSWWTFNCTFSNSDAFLVLQMTHHGTKYGKISTRISSPYWWKEPHPNPNTIPILTQTLTQTLNLKQTLNLILILNLTLILTLKFKIGGAWVEILPKVLCCCTASLGSTHRLTTGINSHTQMP